MTAHTSYLDLAVEPSARQKAYRKLFHNLIDEQLLTRIRKNTNECGVIGDRRFREQIEAMLGGTVPTGKRGRPRRVQ
jgi:putative transposase